ncbi:MAG: sulfite exporter TauE/SafE family protein [Saprospiraceae bacterium]|jgi:uncharacterized protein|nr:sulfite exporter TauE/SafE family protein [Saprospiraceae bacterium]MDP4819723.1 sulfite exporter TauE/SafE family protein [Saprospiraceae bacterium]MDP4998605.1 sulfite exporter TauE/SafE family protein [Saprospiraceae bacterium]
MLDWYHYLIAIVGSAFAGAINTLAGNGSAITLTILTEMLGLTPNVANATNRVGVVAQSLGSTWAFYVNGKLEMKRSMPYLITMLVGSVAGVLVALWVSNDQFKAVFKFLMVFMLVVILVKPKRWLRETSIETRPNLWIAIPVFLAIGFYGGFIQMGMGIFFLTAMVLGAKYSLMDANVVKSFAVGLYTLLAVLIFAWQGMIDWKMGLIMAFGQIIGGYLMAHYASRFAGANVWAHRVLVVVVIAAVLRLFNVF